MALNQKGYVAANLKHHLLMVTEHQKDSKSFMGFLSNTCYLDHLMNSLLLCSCLLHTLHVGILVVFLYVLELESTPKKKNLQSRLL